MSLPQQSDPSPDSDDSLSNRTRRKIAQLTSMGPRDLWWRFLDALETRTVLRRSIYVIVAAGVIGGVASIWVYPWWRQRTVIAMSEQWLKADKLPQASESIQTALKVAPQNPRSWKLAADLARRLGNVDNAADYSEKAASLAPDDTLLALAWAADALLANQPEESQRALATLSDEARSGSSHAQRLLGELARRRLELTEARNHFETALRLDGANSAINEIPLGIILLNARDDAERRRGLELLVKWTTSVEWGANALRALLNDALLHDDRDAMLRWANFLRTHPRCTLGDIPSCLVALSKTDEPRLREVLAAMKKNHAGDPGNVAVLVGWLNQIGRPAEAVEWTRTLPENLTRRPPAIVAIAEALRAGKAWNDLDQWTRGGPWTEDLEMIHLGYRLEAMTRLDNKTEATALRRSLEAKVPGNGGKTLFAANTLYVWGRTQEAVALLWLAADQRGSSFEALGTLARHYQETRDAAGQYRVFKRLRTLRADDASIANNFAFFAALTNQDLIPAGEIASRNFRAEPNNRVWRATQSFVELRRGHAAQALATIQPVGADWKEYPGVAFAYGLALAANGKKTEAREILEKLNPRAMTEDEVALIKTALN